MTPDEAQIEFLESLHDASRRNIITWRIIEDDDRDAFAAIVDGETLEVELLYIPGAPGRGSERGFVRVSGLKTYFIYAAGTHGYNIIMSMLSLHIFGWAEGTAGALKHLARATQTVRALLQQWESPRQPVSELTMDPKTKNSQQCAPPNCPRPSGQ